VAEAHAKMLHNAHIDYAAVDIMNWPVVTPSTDKEVIRTTEVLFEEWFALRKRGIPTPKIAVWLCSPAATAANPKTTSWKYFLDHLYNNPVYDELIYKIDGKKVVFIPKNSACYDVKAEQLIRSNGGRNDVIAVPMWALMSQKDFENGVWGFFSGCVSQKTNQLTTSMVGEKDCNQFVTHFNGDPKRKQVSVSPSYQ
jgi:hypothetical protein